MKIRHGFQFYEFPLHEPARAAVRHRYRTERLRTQNPQHAREQALDQAIWCVAAPHVTKLGPTPDCPEWAR